MTTGIGFSKNSNKPGIFSRLLSFLSHKNDAKISTLSEKDEAILKELYSHLPQLTDKNFIENPDKIVLETAKKSRPIADLKKTNTSDKVVKITKGVTELDKRMRKINSIVTTKTSKLSPKELAQHLKKLDATMSEEAALETLRQHRWKQGVTCPHCRSYRISRRGVHPRNPYCYCYSCDACGANFDDLTGTGFSQYVRSLRRWILCWLYSGFDLTIDKIAKLMGVSEEVVGNMLDVLKTSMPDAKASHKSIMHLDGEKHMNNEEDRRMHHRRRDARSSSKK